MGDDFEMITVAIYWYLEAMIYPKDVSGRGNAKSIAYWKRKMKIQPKILKVVLIEAHFKHVPYLVLTSDSLLDNTKEHKMRMRKYLPNSTLEPTLP